MSSIVYDSPELQVIYAPGTSDFLLATFSTVSEVADGNYFWGKEFCKEYGIRTLGFVAKRPNFFPVSCVEKAITAIDDLLRASPRTITFGTSMGGYAALKHAARLRATETLAFAPLFSAMASDIGHFESRHLGHSHETIKGGRAIKPEELSPWSVVFYDPFCGDDCEHAKLIASLSQDVSLVTAPHTEHFPIALFAKSGVRWQLLEAATQRDVAAITRLTAKQRRLSPIRVISLVERLADSEPDMAQRMLRQYTQKILVAGVGVESDIGQGEFQQATSKFALRVAAVARRVGELDLAIRCARFSVGASPNVLAAYKSLYELLIQADRQDEADSVRKIAISTFANEFLEFQPTT